MIADAVSFRSVRQDDKELLLQWRNEPTTWRCCIQCRPVTAQEHENWFEGIWTRDDVKLFILLYNGTPVGQIRYDLQKLESKVSLTVSPNYRGKGVGVEGLLRTSAEMFKVTAITQVVALVRNDNISSLRCFEKVGFLKSGKQMIQGHNYEKLILSRMLSA